MGSYEESIKRYDGSPYWIANDDDGGYDRNHAAPEGHEMSWALSRGGFVDQALCECGWKSLQFWDGAEWAGDEHDKHLAELAGVEWMPE